MSFILRRVLSAIPVFIGASTLTFFLLHLIPGDPVEIMLGEQATSIDKDALRRDLGLDKSLVDQYAAFCGGLLRFDLGRSLQSRRPVLSEIFERLPATAALAFAAMAIALGVGVPLGVVSAVRKATWWDHMIRLGGMIALSTPSFWLGPVLILIFAVELDLFPVSEEPGLASLVLPAATLAFSLGSVLMQTTRAAMLEVVKEDYINVARAKGASFARLYFKHALGNAIMPLITVVGLQFGAVLTGTVIIETVFDLPGIGTLLFQAIQSRNYPLVQGCVLVISFIYVSVNLLTDIAYAAANPKVRLS